jgi:lipopolysaccharide export LptBFGC system permease protein LptF
MVFSNLFSSSFLLSIAIFILIGGIILAYVSYKLSEQDHKLNSMIGLISTMAEELHFFRSKLNNLPKNNINEFNNTDKIIQLSNFEDNNDLIDVSDNDEEDEDEEEEDEEEEDGDDDENEDDDEEDEDEEDEDEENDNDNDDVLDVINLSLENENLDNDEIEDLGSNELKLTKTIHLENPLVEQEIMNLNDKHEELLGDDLTFLKNISEEDDSKTDYKKMSVNKLRDIVVTKGLSQDSSRLKKNELLKLLGDE